MQSFPPPAPRQPSRMSDLAVVALMVLIVAFFLWVLISAVFDTFSTGGEPGPVDRCTRIAREQEARGLDFESERLACRRLEEVFEN